MAEGGAAASCRRRGAQRIGRRIGRRAWIAAVTRKFGRMHALAGADWIYRCVRAEDIARRRGCEAPPARPPDRRGVDTAVRDIAVDIGVICHVARRADEALRLWRISCIRSEIPIGEMRLGHKCPRR
jgi:hypothetical protein